MAKNTRRKCFLKHYVFLPLDLASIRRYALEPGSTKDACANTTNELPLQGGKTHKLYVSRLSWGRFLTIENSFSEVCDYRSLIPCWQNVIWLGNEKWIIFGETLLFEQRIRENLFFFHCERRKVGENNPC